jgi:hypothetical protein
VAILILQLKLKVISGAVSKEAWASVLWPYGVLIVLLILISASRAPVSVDRDRYDQLCSKDARISQLDADINGLASTLSLKEQEIDRLKNPLSESKRLNFVEKMRLLTSEEKDVLYYFVSTGSPIVPPYYGFNADMFLSIALKTGFIKQGFHGYEVNSELRPLLEKWASEYPSLPEEPQATA